MHIKTDARKIIDMDFQNNFFFKIMFEMILKYSLVNNYCKVPIIRIS